MKTYSIKTVDGSRFDYVDVDNLIISVENLVAHLAENCFMGFPVENGNKYFNLRNIVSITEREVDE